MTEASNTAGDRTTAPLAPATPQPALVSTSVIEHCSGARSSARPIARGAQFAPLLGGDREFSGESVSSPLSIPLPPLIGRRLGIGAGQRVQDPQARHCQEIIERVGHALLCLSSSPRQSLTMARRAAVAGDRAIEV
jgi:hypothetical protein